ncbi:MAG: hypothetical protein CSA96_07455 [Bacteroidetes bacterium]|nr:MAG: hypothetical protein CSA96_07455 [Bacteroidota bacterium]
MTTVEEGGTLQLSATVLPVNASDPTVSWSVENGTGSANITATGELSAISAGTVRAIARANDGSGVSGELELRISARPVLVTSVSVYPLSGTNEITVGDSVQLVVKVLPGNATNPSTELSIVDGKDIASLDAGGLLKALAPGLVNVMVEALDGSGEWDYCSLIISEVNSSGPSFADEKPLVYPNPGEGRFFIQNKAGKIDRVQVSSPTGAVIADLKVADGVSPVVIELSDRSYGMYVFRIYSGKQLVQTKVIHIQK